MSIASSNRYRSSSRRLPILLIGALALSLSQTSSFALGAGDAYHLIFGIALHDEGQFTPVGQTDGVSFAVQVATAGAKDGKEIFRRHIDKSQRQIDYESIDLSAYAGQVIRLRLIADPGPAGDATYDWGVWVDPRIVAGPLPEEWWNKENLEEPAQATKVIFSAIDSYGRATLGVGDRTGERAGAVFSPDAFPVGWDVSAMPWPTKVCYGQRVRGIFAQPAWDGQVAPSWGQYTIGLGVATPEPAPAEAGVEAGAEQDVAGAAEQLKSAAAMAQTLQALIAQGRAGGLEMRLPRVTAAVLKIFLPRIQDDLDGLGRYAGPNFPGWYDAGPPYGYTHAVVKLSDKGKSAEFVAQRRQRGIEMAAYLVRSAQRAIAEAREILAHPETDVKYPDYAVSRLSVRDGYFYDGEQPALLTGLYTNYDVTPDYGALAEAGICFTQPERLNLHCTLPAEGQVSTEFIDQFVVRDTLAPAQLANIGCVLDLGLQYLPGWVREKYPTLINPGSANNPYGPYSIVSDEMKALTCQYLDQLVPRARQFWSAIGYEMANQAYHNPWSPQVIAMFREWVKDRYGTIERANAAWSSSFRSFEDVKPLENLRKIEPLGLRYDWILFQHELTGSWHRWLKDQIKQRDPRALVEVQLAGNLFQPQKFEGHDCTRVGIDEIDLYRNITDISGIDFCTWYWSRFVYEQAGQHLDLLRSIAPDKPVINFEYGLGTYNTSVSWPADYVRASLWYSYLHGMAGNAIWAWTVSELADESQQNTFARWPDRLEVLGRTALELRRFAPQIVAFGRQKAQVGILYSAPSRWFDQQREGDYYQQARNMWHAASMTDAPLEFVSDEQIAQGELDRFKVLLVPGCAYVTDDTFDRIGAFVAGGGSVLMTANSFGRDAYDKPRTLPASWTSKRNLSEYLTPNARPTRQGKGAIYNVNPAGTEDYQRLLDLIETRAGVLRPARAVLAGGGGVNRSVELRLARAKQPGEYLLYCFNLSAEPVNLRLRVQAGYQIAGPDLLAARPATGEIKLQPMELCIWNVRGPGK